MITKRQILASMLCACMPAAFAFAADADRPAERPSVLVVVGAEGSHEFGPLFRQWAQRWSDAAARGQAKCQVIGLDEPGKTTDREAWQEFMNAQTKLPASTPFWLVLIGHGTFDGKTARFNLRGPDVSSAELAGWLHKIESPAAVINCASSSGPFLADLSAANRVVITAARSGHEYNFAHFGDFFSAAITDPAADLDKDEQTSLFEAFLAASAKLREFYAAEGRLATEHALLDDNGDRLGTPADWFQGLRLVKESKSAAAPDGDFARQFVLVPNAAEQQWPLPLRERRTALEQRLAELRRRKAKLPEAEYLALLEPLLVELAQLSDQAADVARQGSEKARP
jgi:hypothetical protein